jgi:YafQ family addiction module toxin component
MYKADTKEVLDRKFFKLARKDPKKLKIIYNKIEEIVKNPQRYKNLRSPLNHYKRVHIDRSFVLTFSIDERNKIVIFKDYDHHDKIYKK